jgi:hypothetical protein
MESKHQSNILDDLRSYGKYCECFKIKRANENGVPDIFFTMALTGAVLVELKDDHGDESKIQTHKIEKFNKCGTNCYTVYSFKGWVKLKKDLGINFKNVVDADLDKNGAR